VQLRPEKCGTPVEGGEQLHPILTVQPSIGLPNLNRNALRGLMTQRVGPRYGLRVINSLEIAIPNDVITGIEEIDTIRVHD
jgi:hypothetical protein